MGAAKASTLSGWPLAGSHLKAGCFADTKWQRESKNDAGRGWLRPYLPSACCCSSCTLWQISPATGHVFPTLVNRAAILSLRRKPAARRLN